jgi:hypothetical protein
VLRNAVSSRTHVDCLIRPSPSIFVQYAHTYPPRQYVLIRHMPLIRPYPSNAPVCPFHHPHVCIFVCSYVRILWRGAKETTTFYRFWRVRLALHVTAKGIYIPGFCISTYIQFISYIYTFIYIYTF